MAVDSSHMTASSSALWSRFSQPSNYVNVHVSTMWFMVCRWPQSQEGDWVRRHLCKLARHGPWPVRKWSITDHVWSGRSKTDWQAKFTYANSLTTKVNLLTAKLTQSSQTAVIINGGHHAFSIKRLVLWDLFIAFWQPATLSWCRSYSCITNCYTFFSPIVAK